MLKNKTGYTLLELLITLVLIGIITVMVIPGWFSWMQTTQTAVQVNQLVGALNFARFTAINHNITVSICQSIDGLQCSGTWSDGYIVFSNKNKLSYIDTKENILRVFQRLTYQSSLHWHSQGILHFNAIGMMIARNGQFSVCPINHDLEYARAIIISATGRIRVSKLMSCP